MSKNPRNDTKNELQINQPFQNIISDYTVLGRQIKDLIHLGAYDYILSQMDYNTEPYANELQCVNIETHKNTEILANVFS